MNPGLLRATLTLVTGSVAAHALPLLLGPALTRLYSPDDFGQFVMLSPSFPSRLLGAFPEGTPIRRLPLDEAVNHVAAANVEQRKTAFPAFSPS